MWNIEAHTGYKPITTFWEDFAIAEAFGADAVRDTYERSKRSFKDDVKYMTELVMVLNWRLWMHYEDGKDMFAKLYDELWREADEFCCNHFTGDDLTYYFTTTD